VWLEAARVAWSYKATFASESPQSFQIVVINLDLGYVEFPPDNAIDAHFHETD